MPLSTWAALAFFLVAVAATGALAGREAFRTFRAFGRVGRALDARMSGLEDSLDELTRRLDTLPAKTERVSVELERLARSRAQLSLLLERFADVRRTVTGLRAGAFPK